MCPCLTHSRQGGPNSAGMLRANGHAQDRWDPVGAKILNCSPIRTCQARTDTCPPRLRAHARSQFDVRVDHHLSNRIQLFGRYSFVDTDLFRPGPLQGSLKGRTMTHLAPARTVAGSSCRCYLDVFTIVRSRFSSRMVARQLLYCSAKRRSRWTGRHQLKNVPNDPSIAGGLPKINIEGFDVCRPSYLSASVSDSTCWDPRATFSVHAGKHFVKFETGSLKVSTKINDLNATIGRMKLVEGDEAGIRQAFLNLKLIAESDGRDAAGLRPPDGLRVRSASVRAAREQGTGGALGKPPYPPRTMFKVQRLFDDDIVEIDVSSHQRRSEFILRLGWCKASAPGQFILRGFAALAPQDNERRSMPRARPNYSD